MSGLHDSRRARAVRRYACGRPDAAQARRSWRLLGVGGRLWRRAGRRRHDLRRGCSSDAADPIGIARDGGHERDQKHAAFENFSCHDASRAKTEFAFQENAAFPVGFPAAIDWAGGVSHECVRTDIARRFAGFMS
jgi:hypothetical protein